MAASEAKRRYSQSSHGKAKRKVTRGAYLTSPEGRERARLQGKLWRLKNPERYRVSMRKHDLKRHYGLTPEAWNEIFTNQGSKCAICRTDQPGGKNWATDHDHQTSRVRGILCHHCNRMLGHARDKPNHLLAGAEYLNGAAGTKSAVETGQL